MNVHLVGFLVLLSLAGCMSVLTEYNLSDKVILDSHLSFERTLFRLGMDIVPCLTLDFNTKTFTPIPLYERMRIALEENRPLSTCDSSEVPSGDDNSCCIWKPI